MAEMDSDTLIGIIFSIVVIAILSIGGYAWWTGKLNSNGNTDEDDADVALVGATGVLSSTSRVAEIAEVAAAEEASHRHTQA